MDDSNLSLLSPMNMPHYCRHISMGYSDKMVPKSKATLHIQFFYQRVAELFSTGIFIMVLPTIILIV